MTYYILQEIKIQGGEINRHSVGYTFDKAMAELAIADGQPVFDWVEANQDGLEDGTINPSDTFSEDQSCYTLAWTTGDITGSGLEEITDFSFLVGFEGGA